MILQIRSIIMPGLHCKRSHMQKLIVSHMLKTGLKCILIIGTVTVCLWFWLATSMGLRWTIGTLNTLTPYTIEYKQAQGYMAGPLSFEHVKIKHKDFVMDIGSLRLQWDLKPLLNQIIHFKFLNIEHVVFQPLNSSHEAFSDLNEAPSLQEIHQKFLPLKQHLKVHKLSATDILIKSSSPIKIEKFNFSNASKKGLSSSLSLLLQGQFGQISLEGDHSLKAHFDLSIDDLSVWSKHLKGNMKGRGTLSIADQARWFESTYLSATIDSSHLVYLGTAVDQLRLSTKGQLTQLTTEFSAEHHGQKIKIGTKAQIDEKSCKIIIKPTHWQHPTVGSMPQISGEISLCKNKLWTAALDLKTQDNNEITGFWRVNPSQSYALNGHLTATLKNLSFLNLFSPEVSALKGSAKASIQFTGSLSKPILKTEGTINQLFIPLKSLATDLQLHSIHVSQENLGQFNIHGSGTLGGGAFAIKGKGSIKEFLPDVSLQLTGQDLLLSQTPEYFIKASPNLLLQLKQGQANLSGDMSIDEAHIHIEQLNNSVNVSPDVVIVHSKKSTAIQPHSEVAKPFATLHSNIKITLGNQVHFKGFGLDTRLKGSLQLKNAPNHPMKATGKIQLVDGTYKTRGKKLELTKAQLVFADSPLTNPALDIKGQRHIKHTAQVSNTKDYFDPTIIHNGPLMVGVTLKGTLKSPVLRLFSTPTLPEGDILSYLILDKPQRAASLTEGKLLFTAANELLYQFGSKTTDIRPALHEQFNVDKLELQSNPNKDGRSGLEDTALVVGKQISSKLYAEYSLGIIDTASTIHLRYLLGKHVTLETSASRSSVSADLLFLFESG